MGNWSRQNCLAHPSGLTDLNQNLKFRFLKWSFIKDKTSFWKIGPSIFKSNAILYQELKNSDWLESVCFVNMRS